MVETETDNFVASRITTIRKQIADIIQKSGRDPDSVNLLAVSKFHTSESVISAIQAGQMLFGENRVQEAFTKFQEINKKGLYPELHIIGSLQLNKVKKAVLISSCIESVDRMEVLCEIEKQCTNLNKKIRIFFELHTAEASKSGFSDQSALYEAVSYCANGFAPHCIPAGFMTMAPDTNDEKAIRNSFRMLRTAAESLRQSFPQFPLAELSMGMSKDFPVAIEEGATEVRIGTALFGERL
jgi:PLP dependent protein